MTTHTDTQTILDRKEWPKDSIGREADLSGFIKLLEACEGPVRMWISDFRLKYLDLTIDTRERSFILKDRDGNRIDPMEVVKATRLTLEAYT